MKDTTLTKIYYTSPTEYENVYRERFNSPLSFHLNIDIKQYRRRKSYPAFFYYSKDCALYTEKIYSEYKHFLSLVGNTLPVVLRQFTLLSILDEVKATNDIEGINSTRKEIRDILDGNAGKTDRLESIVNKYRSLLDNREIPFSTCRDLRAFYDEFAHNEIIKENSAHALDGDIFRKDPVDIESPTGKIIHRGVFPESKIIENLETALEILHSDEYPLLVRLGLFHYLFAYIHPFYDGNGRTDRFITSYFLKQDFHTLLALRLSVYIKKNRKTYYELFKENDSEINRGDLTPFVIGFLKMILGTIEDTINLLNRKSEQIEKYREKIYSLDLSDPLLNDIYFILLQASLFYGDGIHISQLVDITGKTRKTIQKRIDAIPKENLIIEKKQKTYYYRLNLRSAPWMLS